MPETSISPVQRVSSILFADGTKKAFEARFKEASMAKGFMGSVLSIVQANDSLQKVNDPMTIIKAALIAAELDLSLTLGHAYIVPYKGQATFQMGWAGYVQLFLRTGQAKSINALVIHEGDIKRRDRLSGEIELTDEEHLTAPVVGYLSYFTLKNGYSHGWFMSVEEVEIHAKKYSQSYQYDIREGKKASRWSTDRDAMALKTVTKMNLKKYAPLSIEMQAAIEQDDAIETEGHTVYPDAPATEPALPSATPVPGTSNRLQKAIAPVPVAAPVSVPQQLPDEDAGETPTDTELPL